MSHKGTDHMLLKHHMFSYEKKLCKRSLHKKHIVNLMECDKEVLTK